MTGQTGTDGLGAGAARLFSVHTEVIRVRDDRRLLVDGWTAAGRRVCGGKRFVIHINPKFDQSFNT